MDPGEKKQIKSTTEVEQDPPLIKHTTRNNEPVIPMGFTQKHLTIIGFYGIANIFRASLALINGPFYPPEAKAKGATGTEIGIVFAAQDLTVVFMSLLYGKKIMRLLGPQRLVNGSFMGVGICAILFGCTVLIENRILFVGTSILIRIVTGIFDGGIYPAVFTIYSIETPALISTTIALFEVFFGIGAVAGPVLCGMLLEVVGFTWTYVAVGSCIIVAAVAIFLFVPEVENKLDQTPNNGQGGSGIHPPGFLRLLSIPRVMLVIFSLSTTSASIGCITATLALHYDYLSPTMSGALFSGGTAIYTIFCPLWGYAADHGLISKTTIVMTAAGFIILGFSFLGPLPFLPFQPSTWAGFVGYGIHGFGIGGSIMTSYHHALEAALAEGFPDDSSTYGLVSSVYIATFAMGSAIGPPISGVMYDYVGFRWATVVIIALAFLVIIATLLLKFFNHKKRIGEIDS